MILLTLPAFLLIRSSTNSLKAPRFSSFYLYANTQHVESRMKVQNLQFLPTMIVEDYPQTKKSEVSQIISFPVSEAYMKLPKASQIVSIGKLSLQLSVSLLISPTEMSVVPFCQSICAHSGIEKPIICYHLIHAYNGPHSKDSALVKNEQNPSLSKYTRDCFPLLAIVLSLLTSLFCQRFELVSSLLN